MKKLTKRAKTEPSHFPLFDLPQPILLRIINEYLQLNAVFNLTCTSHWCSDLTAPLRIQILARIGDLDRVTKMLIAAKNRENDPTLLKLLIQTAIPSPWRDRNLMRVVHHDTLLQLAWRMRDMRMVYTIFNKLKTSNFKRSGSLGFDNFLKIATDQIANFQGDQSIALRLLIKKARKEHEKLCSNEQQFSQWKQKIRGLQQMLFYEMPWVIHLMCTKNSGWHESQFKKFYTRDVDTAYSLFMHKQGAGYLPRNQVLVREDTRWNMGELLRFSEYSTALAQGYVNNMTMLVKLSNENNSEIINHPLNPNKQVR